tara:strand:+ start:1594 stop:1947 length:354 start_codon:yes stop_codon:yes gene_type:complete
MKFKRSQRLQELFLKEISLLLQKGLKDPRIGFVTVTRIKLTDNLKHAKIYFSVFGNESEIKSSLDGLKSARGFIRGHLGKSLYLKHVPELEFLKDENPDHVDKISKLLDQIHSDGGS